jgi:hypothetical protein
MTLASLDLMRMRIFVTTSGCLTFALKLAACGGVAANPLGGGGADAAGDSRSGDAGMASIQIGNCPAFAPCGGDVVGTWAFAGGCVDDPLSTSRALCPSLQVNSETASASGTVTFTADQVTRSYQTRYAMDVVIPTACLLGKPCTQLQTALSAYIPNANCQTVSAGCGCTGSVISSATQQSGYTTANDEVATAADHYAYCVSGGDMQYQHVAGPSPELGAYHLIKR